MKISELSAVTDVPVGTIKYYLREGLLAPGERTSRTTARYDQGHVERIRLVRALTDAGGLGIAQIKRVVTVIDAEDPPRLDVLATAQDALVGGREPVGHHECSGAPGAPGAPEGLAEPDADEPALDAAEPAPSRARGWVSGRGWFSYEGDQVIERFDTAWAACEEAGIDVDETLMDQYADAALQIARIDLASVPSGADDAVRRVIVGTIMLEPVLAALRLLAQRQLAITGHDTSE